MRFAWCCVCFFVFLVCLVLVACYLGYQELKPNRYMEVKRIAGPVYEPRPQPYGKKEITEAVREKAEFQVLD